MLKLPLWIIKMMKLHPIHDGNFWQVFYLKINNTTSIYIAIETYGRKMIWDPVKKETDHQFHVGYMTHILLKNIRPIRSSLSNFLVGIRISHIKVYQKWVIKKECICSFIYDFYGNRKTLMYKVIGSVIYNGVQPKMPPTISFSGMYG